MFFTLCMLQIGGLSSQPLLPCDQHLVALLNNEMVTPLNGFQCVIVKSQILTNNFPFVDVLSNYLE